MNNIPFSLIQVFNEPGLNFKGNIAAVVLLEEPWNDRKMQDWATELNQPATSFLWPYHEKNQFSVRWFAPDEEIFLCGHGALAVIAYLSKNLKLNEPAQLVFPSGTISGKPEAENSCSITLDSIPVLSKEEVNPLFQEALGISIKEHFTTLNKHILVAENEQDVKNMKPDFVKLRESEILGYAVTAPGHQVDFVSRTLIPHYLQLEDHATGSSHAALAPFWAKKLNKKELIAHQLSPRGGSFKCQIKEKTVKLTGNFNIFAEGKLTENNV
ncbi:PhzF family phenazine biosynthesis protein [soil metagenome]